MDCKYFKEIYIYIVYTVYIVYIYIYYIILNVKYTFFKRK